ncbi:MAG TPA: hypothetical protein VLX12_04755, partial [Syntrophorhabdales bacterium]|nr:hypothetical protein [Syntrophorhabdales bacterium]
KVPTPSNDGTYDIPFQVTVKHTPRADEFEMYNVTDDPMELTNLYSATNPLPQQATLAQLLQQQCAQKRLTPCSGNVPGQPECGQQTCSI